MAAKLCKLCGCPMKPKGAKKREGEYDHACGCRYHRHTAYCPYTQQMAEAREFSESMTRDCGFSHTIGTVTFNKDFWK